MKGFRVTIDINGFSMVLEKASDGHQWFTEKRELQKQVYFLRGMAILKLAWDVIFWWRNAPEHLAK